MSFALCTAQCRLIVQDWPSSMSFNIGSLHAALLLQVLILILLVRLPFGSQGWSSNEACNTTTCMDVLFAACRRCMMYLLQSAQQLAGRQADTEAWQAPPQPSGDSIEPRQAQAVQRASRCIQLLLLAATASQVGAVLSVVACPTALAAVGICWLLATCGPHRCPVPTSYTLLMTTSQCHLFAICVPTATGDAPAGLLRPVT